MDKIAFVLLSGGIDSTTCLFKALKDMDGNPNRVKAFSMDYGQLHSKEMEAAKSICEAHNIEHQIIDIRGFAQGPLTDKPEAIPDCSYSDIQGMSPTYMPFRNGMMLSQLAAKAQEYVLFIQRKEEERLLLSDTFSFEEVQKTVFQSLEDFVWIYFGAHSEDAHNWAYPDCTPEFIGAMANAIYIGTYRTVRLVTPFAYSSKADIVRKGYEIGAPLHHTWSCYKGLEKHCGTCPTCLARKQAFIDARIPDLTEYLA